MKKTRRSFDKCVGPSLLISISMAIAGTAVACDRNSSSKEQAATVEARPIGHAECAACAMVVIEQPAPRGQVAHRDGTHEHFCSLGDFVQYVQSPSPHGPIVASYVEVVSPEVPPDEIDSKPRKWVPADQARYMVDIERTGVMGPGIVAYESMEDATRAAERHDGRIVGWKELPDIVAQH